MRAAGNDPQSTPGRGGVRVRVKIRVMVRVRVRIRVRVRVRVGVRVRVRPRGPEGVGGVEGGSPPNKSPCGAVVRASGS